MNGIHPDLLKQMKEYYKPGTRVMLIRMSDPYTNLRQGDRGTVICVDDIGSVHVAWDRGSTLGVAFGEDECVKIEEDDHE
jgi:hypothetical protein